MILSTMWRSLIPLACLAMAMWPAPLHTRSHLDSNVVQLLAVRESDRLPGHGRNPLAVLGRNVVRLTDSNELITGGGRHITNGEPSIPVCRCRERQHPAVGFRFLDRHRDGA